MALFVTFGLLYFLLSFLMDYINYKQIAYKIDSLNIKKDSYFSFFNNYKDKIVSKYLNLSFRSFISREMFKFKIVNVKSNFKKELKDFNRFLNLYLMRFYNSFNDLDVLFARDLFVRPFTNGKYAHFNVLNIYGLTNKDLFNVTYCYLMSDPNIFYDLENYSVYFTLTSFRDIETDYASVVNINPDIIINKYTTFQELYLAIVTYYSEVGPVKDLDNTYRLEIRVMRF
jgi:hypothetical protein